jgi:hypothetical protein
LIRTADQTVKAARKATMIGKKSIVHKKTSLKPERSLRKKVKKNYKVLTNRL